jgi:small GTP-binding protein
MLVNIFSISRDPILKSSFHNSMIVAESDKYKPLNPMNKPDKSAINIVLCGDSGVGKSAIVIRYNTRKFDPYHVVSFSVEEYKREATYEGNTYGMNFYIIPGDKQYQKDYSEIYQNADFFVNCFDVTSKKSYQRSLDILSGDIYKHIRLIGNSPNVIMLANKVDFKERNVNIEEASKYCSENGYEFYETSVKNNLNIVRVFTRILELYDNLLNKREGE